MSGGQPGHHQQLCLFWPSCSCVGGPTACSMVPTERSEGVSPDGVGALSDADLVEEIVPSEGELPAIAAPGQSLSFEEFYDPPPCIYSIVLIEVAND